MTAATVKLAREAQAAINKQYYDLLGASDILDDLTQKFELATMVRHRVDARPDGTLFKANVDASATMAQCGAYDVLSYIRQRIKLGEEGK